MEIDYDHTLTTYEGPPREMTPFLWATVALLLEKAPDQFMEKDLYPFITQKRFNMVLVRLWKAGVLKRYDTKSGKSPKWELDIERLRAMPLNPEIRALVEERARRQQSQYAQNSQEPWRIGLDRISTHKPPERRWVHKG